MDLLNKMLVIEHRDILAYQCKYLPLEMYDIFMKQSHYFNNFVTNNKKVLSDYEDKKDDLRVKVIVEDINSLSLRITGIHCQNFIHLKNIMHLENIIFPGLKQEIVDYNIYYENIYITHVKKLDDKTEFCQIEISKIDYEEKDYFCEHMYHTTSIGLINEILTYYVKHNFEINDYTDNKEIYQRL